MVIRLVFGLIHGFGFAADLLQMQIPTLRLAELLVGFNLGVEIDQLTLVLATTLLVIGLSRRVLVCKPQLCLGLGHGRSGIFIKTARLVDGGKVLIVSSSPAPSFDPGGRTADDDL